MQYSKHTTVYFGVWAATALAKGNCEQLHKALSRVDQAHHA
jgi:hypothetical protein